MPRSIDEGFKDFLNKLTPLRSESLPLVGHRLSIKQCLESNYNLKYFFKTGSIGHGTNVSGHSDTDYFAVIPADKLKNDSSITMRLIKDKLIARFPSTKNIHVDSPAIVVPFGTYASEITEVIPADHVKTEAGYNVYEIPDGNGGWIKTSPHKHNEYVAAIDKKHGGKVKSLIRFIKAWKYFRNVPISSFYLEMQIARYAHAEDSIVYSIDVKNIFKQLNDAGLSAMIDPTGVSGYIHSCSSDVKKTDALSKIATAAVRAENARTCEVAGKIDDAFDWWRLLYGDKFPTYYY